MTKDQLALLNRAKSLLSLRIIRTRRDACKQLGTDVNIISSHFNGELDVKTSKAEIDQIALILEKHLEDTTREIQAQEPPSPLEEEGEKILSNINKTPAWLTYKYPSHNSQQIARCLPKQLNTAKKIYYSFVEEKKHAALMPVDVGQGKTYVYGQIIRWLIDSGWMKGNSISPWPILVVTRSTIVVQTRRVMEEFGIDTNIVEVINIDALRANWGDMRFYDWKTEVRFGQEYRFCIWRPYIHPALFIWDECQSLKNVDSKQSRVAQAACDLPNAFHIFSSATPFAKISSAKCFCIATKKPIAWGWNEEVPLIGERWKSYAEKSLATNANINLYCPKAMKRLMRQFNDYIYSYRIEPEYPPYNVVEQIEFETEDQKQRYNIAWETYCEFRSKVKNSNSPAGEMLILAQLQIFRITADTIKAEQELPRRMWKLMNEGKMPICAVPFKPTVAKIVMRLTQDYNISRDSISLIWGGDAALTQETSLTREQIHEILAKALSGEEIPDKKLIGQITKQLRYENLGLKEIPEDLRLGIQTPEQRQSEIDRFQTGKSRFCIFTFQAGGVGLSLHHDRDSTSQREVILTPTWNEMEMAQALGRGARLTSKSPTRQTILCYKNTIEVRVLMRMQQKTKCLHAVDAHEKDAYIQEAEEIIDILGKPVGEDEFDEQKAKEMWKDYDKEEGDAI